MARNNNDKRSLIILGNSGVGKSSLANILLDGEAFKHEFSARSVTHETEFQEITINDQDYAIFNVPGLIEADQTRSIDQQAKEAKKMEEKRAAEIRHMKQQLKHIQAEQQRQRTNRRY